MLQLLQEELQKGVGTRRANIQFTDGEHLGNVRIRGADALGIAFENETSAGSITFTPRNALFALTILDNPR